VTTISQELPTTTSLSFQLLEIDCAQEAQRIEASIREFVFQQLRRRGVVVGVSGGIDSSVVLSLCARALGPDRVLALLMPEAESSPATLQLSELAAASQGVSTQIEDITATLQVLGCYQRRDDALRKVIPQYSSFWKSKIVLPNVIDGNSYRVFSVIAKSPDGTMVKKRLTWEAYLAVVAATNFKQRVRKMLEYYHADRLNYAVAGTPNRLEYDQGFFVKGGDGLADLKPIAHLYKSAVYQLAEYLGVPEEIRRRPPTTDTYSLPQGQDEFYFSLSYKQMDLCLYAKNHGFPATDVADLLQLHPEQVERVYRDIDHKRRTTRYLHLPPLLVATDSDSPVAQ
jgi:NAD+ synthase